MLLQDFLQLAGGGVPDVDRVILRPDSNELTVGGKGGAGPVATSLESLAAKCRTNLRIWKLVKSEGHRRSSS